MIKQEWKNIFHNTWIKVVFIAIILIPSIYACVFLGSMWDPYGNSGDLPVAIVNEDEEVTYNDKTLNVGKELVDNLKENHSLDFHFVDANDAFNGLENGDYYMVVTIPSDFSKNATTLLDDEPQKMILRYTTNPGTNYVASKMDDSAIAKIKEEVSTSVTKTYAKTLFTSLGTLSHGLFDASDGTQQLLDGMNQLSDGNEKISKNLEILASSTLTFQDGSQTLTKGLKDYTDGVLNIHNGTYSLKNGLKTLNNSTQDLSLGVNQLNDGAQRLQEGIQNYTKSVAQVVFGTNSLVENNDKLNNGIQSLTQGVTQVQDVNLKLKHGLVNIANQLKNSLPNDATKNQMQGVQNYVLKLTKDAAQSQQFNQEAIEFLEKSSLNSDEKEILLKALKTSSEMNSYIIGNDDHVGLELMTSQMIESQTKNVDGLKNLYDAFVQSTDDPINEPHKVGLIQASEIVTSGLDQINYGLTDPQNGLQNGLKVYTDSVEQISQGLNTLISYHVTLNEGSQQLVSGLNVMKQSTPPLVNGIQQLSDGANHLYQGASQLIEYNSILMNGSKKLTSGAGLMNQGASRLTNGSKTLGSGIADAKGGTKTLHDALSTGAKKSQIDFTDLTTDMMSAPLDVEHIEISKVENNGHAMAPYMMSVALYVSALAFTLMYPIREGIKGVKNGLKYWASKATVMYSISTLCAIMMVSSLVYFNGFEPEHLLLTYLFAILVSATFMSLVMLLSLTTGYIGEFLLLIFMIINLGGSAGTYPLDTSSSFYKMIHPFVPYTYSVDGFRKTISITSPSLNKEIWIFVAIIIVCSILTIAYYQYKNKEDKHMVPQAFEKVNE